MTWAFGIPWLVCIKGCLWCASESARLGEEFKAAVARGEYDREGYTPAERRKRQR